ncbi:MAG: SH3 domain-containing protein [Methylocystis sp.]|uniref:SH3 domain-containing protein n=1 Tax=Methylocystis sp. TaxID=1911079 RepID=UPI003D0C79EF
MRLRLALLLAAGFGALPGSAAAFEAFVAAPMPLRVSPSSSARPVTTMAANIPFNVLGCGRWCQVQYGGTMGYVPAPLVIPGAPPPAPGVVAAPLVLPFAAPDLLSDGYAPRVDYGYGLTPYFGTPPGPYCGEPARRRRCVSRKAAHREMRERPPM